MFLGSLHESLHFEWIWGHQQIVYGLLFGVILESTVIEPAECFNTVPQESENSLLTVSGHVGRCTSCSRIYVTDLVTIVSPQILVLDDEIM